MRMTLAMIAGVLVAFVLGSVIGTQMILHSVQSMGLQVSWAMRAESTMNDLIGLAGTLLPIIAIALIPAWLIVAWFTRKSDSAWEAWIFVTVGAACVACVYPAMNFAFGVDVYAPARTLAGVLGQAAAAGLGGLCVATLRKRPR